ncbi:MAG: hypothetical protein ABI383_07320 [Acidobacteriaceae bacterium]
MDNTPDFTLMKEADVREIMVRPLIERLGYRHGTDATIRTELTLKYDHNFLARKNPKKDPPLREKSTISAMSYSNNELLAHLIVPSRVFLQTSFVTASARPGIK